MKKNEENVGHVLHLSVESSSTLRAPPSIAILGCGLERLQQNLRERMKT